MIDIFLTRLRQGHRTIAYPRKAPALPDRYQGRPVLAPDRCLPECSECFDLCPTGAMVRHHQAPVIDLGRCLFCGACAEACAHGVIRFSAEHRLAARRRDDLRISQAESTGACAALEEKSRRLFGHSLKLRQVSAGGCNACEADTNVLGTVVFDLARFGVQFVASPRHADGLLITGPVPHNMRLALRKTYDAVPDPKIVIVVGACAIDGGPYAGHDEVNGGVGELLPVDLYVPGCPPHPLTILDGILALLGRRG